jgi:hypothetical protein
MDSSLVAAVEEAAVLVKERIGTNDPVIIGDVDGGVIPEVEIEGRIEEEKVAAAEAAVKDFQAVQVVLEAATAVVEVVMVVKAVLEAAVVAAAMALVAAAMVEVMVVMVVVVIVVAVAKVDLLLSQVVEV